MILKEIYKKDIERNIQGVIKVDDEREDAIKQELEEYIVTGEIERHFNEFYDSYTTSLGSGRTDKMGVWISGFFGSGKSHFLKMIAYLLENKEIYGKKAVDYFENKITDAMLFGNIKRSGAISSDVILFNIDAKAGLENTTQKDRILKVLENVFNEKLGYSHVNYVADVERYLDENGKYEEFKSKFAEGWENVRDDFDFEQERVAKAYADVMGVTIEEANRTFDARRDNHDISPEKFAERVQKYIESKGNDHHVVFLIDEVGQYIGEQGDLLLNLQSIVEELGVRTGGKAWVVCTSQEAIDDIIKIKRNDFSKILGRFDTKIKLASTDIEEVIKMRLLEKTDVAAETLLARYNQDQAEIRNAFSFSAGTQTQKLYRDVNDFVATYPYVPYQFALVQNTYTYIREKGFAGAHLSSGARSLLGAIQETAKTNKDAEIGTLIPFSAFFETIKTAIDSSVVRIIDRAESIVREGKLNSEDIPILKTLFMLRGSKEIPSTVENIATLELHRIDEDKLELEKSVRNSLKRLEDEFFINKNNDDTYSFLTDEEQEVNRAIQNIVVGQERVIEEVGDVLRGIYGSTKFQYQNGRIFSTDLYICDRKLTAGSNELAVVFETQESSARSNSIINSDRIYISVELQPNTEEALRRSIRILEYRRANNTSVSSDSERGKILDDRSREMNQLRAKVQSDIAQILESASVFLGGNQIDIPNAEAKARMNLILGELIKNTFTKIHYIASKKTISDARALLNKPKSEMVTLVNPQAIDEIFEYVNELANQHYPQVPLQSLISKFAKRPYGFDTDDVVYLVARLVRDERFSVSKSSITLNNSEFSAALAQTREYDRIAIRIREKVDNNLLTTAKSVLKDAFERTITENNEDDIIDELRDAIEDEKQLISNLLTNYLGHKYQYPGKDNLENAEQVLRDLIQIKDNSELFAIISERSAEIVDSIHRITSTKDFFSSNQRTIFDHAVEVLIKYDAQSMNFTIDGNEADGIREIITNPEPYKEIYKLPSLVSSLDDKIKAIIEERENREKERREREEKERQEAIAKAKAEGKSPEDIPTKKKRTIRPGDLVKKPYIIKTDSDIDAMLAELKEILKKQLEGNDEVEVF